MLPHLYFQVSLLYGDDFREELDWIGQYNCSRMQKKSTSGWREALKDAFAYSP